jgi:CO/xanthine dehydrogenase FAD-binding subunit
VSVEDPASGYPLAGAAVRTRRDGDRIVACTIAITGVAGNPFRARQLEDLIVDRGQVPAVTEVRDALAGVRAVGDLVADADYRRHLAAVVVCRAAERAFGRAAGRTNEGAAR